MVGSIKNGAVVLSGKGVIGIVDGHKGGVYFGLTLNGKAWETTSPKLLAESVYEYIMNGINNEKPNFLVEIDNFINEVQEGTPVKKKVVK